MDKFTPLLAKEFSRREEHIENILRLLDEGNTVPFIARYRKEMHGTTDDQTIRAIADGHVRRTGSAGRAVCERRKRSYVN